MLTIELNTPSKSKYKFCREITEDWQRDLAHF